MSEFYQAPLQDTRPRDQIELQQKQDKEFKFIGRVRPVPGHTMFSYNLKTGEIKQAPMKYEVYIDMKTRRPIRTKKIVIERDCIYRQALNIRNFVKHLIREGIRVKA